MPATSKAEYTEPNIDERLEDGPLAKRTCRDPICCLLFVAFLGAMFGIAAWGYSQGNPGLIGRGYDYNGRMCGMDDEVKDYPYLYFPIPVSTDYLKMTVCVKSCPKSDSELTVECKPTTYHTDCIGDSTMSSDITAGGSAFDNKFYIYATTGYVSRFCVPQVDGTKFASAANTVLNTDVLEQWISDIRETWPVIAVSIAVAFVIGFIYMVLLRYCSGVLTWFAILAFIAGTAILGWRFYDNATKVASETGSISSTDNSETSTSKTILAQKIIAYVCWGVSGFTFLVVLCLFNRIRLAIAIMKAAADYVKATPSVFIVPPVTVLILLVFYAFWSSAAIFLVSSGDATQMKTLPFGSFTYDKTLKRLLIYHLFALLWVNAFILAATQFILASSTALWYFSQGTGQAAPATIRTSVKRFFKYHFGSIAFGSLILAIIQFIRIVLAYIDAQAQKAKGSENKLVTYTLRCLGCYLACFERFIKFLNKNAYIQIALSGKSFCGATKDAFVLIVNNPLRMGVVSSIGGVFVLFGKIFVAAITALIGFLVLTNWDRYSSQIYSPFIPVLVMFIFAYVVGAVFMTVYGLAADTILACFIVDEQLNKKKNAPPRHCPESLRSFLDEHKKKN
jgi:hypothetical protein